MYITKSEHQKKNAKQNQFFVWTSTFASIFFLLLFCVIFFSLFYSSAAISHFRKQSATIATFFFRFFCGVWNFLVSIWKILRSRSRCYTGVANKDDNKHNGLDCYFHSLHFIMIMSTHFDQEIYIYYAQMWAMNFYFITGLFYIMATICFLIYLNDSFWNKKKSIYFYLVSNSLANLRQKLLRANWI